MRSREYYLVRTIVRGLFWLSVVAAIVLVSGYVWWDGDSFCPGTMTGCVEL